MSGELLPLFPLQLALLPGAPLPLHIFEARYRRMVGGAAEDGSELGVVLAHQDRIESVGCTAVVERVTKRYEDGRFDVLARGVRRFRALELNHDEECLRASVEYFHDDAYPPLEPAERRRLERLAVDAARLVGVSIKELPSPIEPSPSFQLAGQLPLDPAFKQRLLEDRSERSRTAALAEYLETWMQHLAAVERSRAVAGANGHARGS